jgi:class 3 adenylate cyclase
MTRDQVKRKLLAILSADVKGYRPLMGEDEEWTLRTLNGHKEMMGSLIQQHRGRVVGTAGDSCNVFESDRRLSGCSVAQGWAEVRLWKILQRTAEGLGSHFIYNAQS